VSVTADKELLRELAWALAFLLDETSLSCEGCLWRPEKDCEHGCIEGNRKVQLLFAKAKAVGLLTGVLP